MGIKILEHSSAEEYNDKAHHPMQSWEWGEARKKMRIEVVRIADDKDVFQMTLHRIPHTKYKIGYLPRSVIPSFEVMQFLYEFGKKNQVVFIKMEPYAFNTPENKERIIKLKSDSFTLKQSPHPLFPEWSIVLDLKPTEDELLKQMKPKTRYNIKLAQKKGVVIKEMSDDNGFAIFADLYFETCKRQKYHGHTREYHKIIWENLKSNLAHILIAYYEDTPLAAYELFYFKKKFYYPYGGTSLLHRNLMPANLLMWEAVKLGKKLGAETFDMWGALPPNYPENHPWAGFTRFKEGYGGVSQEFIGSYDLVIYPTQYSIYNFVHKARSFALSIR